LGPAVWVIHRSHLGPAVGNSPLLPSSMSLCLSLSRPLSLPLTLTLARSQSPSFSLSRSLTVSLSLSLSLARSHSPSHTHRRFGSCSSVVSFRRFDGGIEGSKPHLRAFLVGVAYLHRKLPPVPAPNAQIRSSKKKKKKACNNLPDFGGVSPESLLIRVLA
jgi:hypothetical protein